MSKIPERAWVEVTGQVRVEHWDPYEGNGPVIHVTSVKACRKPEEEVVQM